MPMIRTRAKYDGIVKTVFPVPLWVQRAEGNKVKFEVVSLVSVIPRDVATKFVAQAPGRPFCF